MISQQPNLDPITLESTREQVKVWLQKYDEGANNFSLLYGCTGAMLLGLSENRLVELCTSKALALALYDTLHPEVKQNIKTVHTEITWPYPAKEAFVKGSWNWNNLYPLQEKDGIWSITIALPPGEYEYIFLVDKEWKNDGSKPFHHINQRNNILQVKNLFSHTANSKYFIIKNCLVSNTEGTCGFEADVFLDTGAGFEICLPHQKIVQLEMEKFELFTEVGTGNLKTQFVVHHFAKDVLLSIPGDEENVFIEHKLEPIYMSHIGQQSHNSPPEPSISNIQPRIERRPIPPTWKRTLSPVRSDESKYEMISIGMVGLTRMGLDLNCKDKILKLAKLFV